MVCCPPWLPRAVYAMHINERPINVATRRRCYGAGHVGAGAQTAVHHDLDPVLVSFGDGREGVDRGLSCVQLTAPVVGDDDAVKTKPDGCLRILFAGDPFYDQFALPHIP